MKYIIARGMEVMRLNPEQIISLQTKEKNLKRCLMPREIQTIFNLSDLKTTYFVPDDEMQQLQQTFRITNDFLSKGLFPKYQYVGELDVEGCHEFDNEILGAGIDFVFSGGPKKKKLRDQVEDESVFDKAEKAIKKSNLVIPLALTMFELWKSSI